MEKIFYTEQNKYHDSTEAIRHILTEYFGVENPRISRTETGKPYLIDTPLFFSVSHTDGLIFIAVSDCNVGIDAERNDRHVDYQKIIKRFPEDERALIRSSTDFLRHWTVKESAVKWLGSSLSHDLRELRYGKDGVFYKEIPLPVYISFPNFKGYMLAVCGERDFSNITPVIIQ